MRLIDAGALYKWVKTECNPYGKPTLDFESGCKVLDMIEQMETVEPERKNGKCTHKNCPIQYSYISDECDIKTCPYRTEKKAGSWIRKPDPYGFFDDIPVCSECGHTTKMREEYKFCPNCGADMRGEDYETD